ncbi:MAG: hypothetical protein JWN68_3002 [Nocardioides sp.]|jgi:uncharacterized protein YlxW (UPF0749 family)|uniref:DUF881 domain-containing protein n=1 Tax=Nocardioides sp. TaxID=35761 RepID=UPI00261D0D0C|nr:DUF881 domain-containing protein [Nocardioides sp.]MCW2835049.1 hypothetical protein [Nocardioides sp.]
MSPESDSRPTAGAHSHQGKRLALGWRIGTPVMVLLSGALFATSAEHSGGTDLRAGRYTDLASVVLAERRTADELIAEVTSLTTQVQTLSAGLGDRSVDRAQRQIELLSDPAGLTARTGPAVKVTLSDAPPDVLDDTTRDPLDVIVHQQDIQATVNALWRAGAEAVTVQGQRLISTTGIKCDGNSVSLQGLSYSPPYEIVAIGVPTRLVTSLESDSYLDIYREAAADPRGGVGYQVEVLAQAVAPAYDGLLDLGYAKPMPDAQR